LTIRTKGKKRLDPMETSIEKKGQEKGQALLLSTGVGGGWGLEGEEEHAYGVIIYWSALAR